MRIAIPILFSVLLPLHADDARAPEGFQSLFNGKNLDGWKNFASKKDRWVVEDGVIVCQGGGGGWLGTNRDYADFELRLEYKLKPGGNSGIYVRAPEEGWISRLGMEIQLLDDFHPRYANLDFYQHTGALYHVAAPTRRATKKAGQWNALTIRAEGRQLQVRLNGVALLDVDLDRCRKDPAVAKEHPGLARTTGRIGLQSHTDRVEFRNIFVREIKP